MGIGLLVVYRIDCSVKSIKVAGASREDKCKELEAEVPDGSSVKADTSNAEVTIPVC